MVDMIVGQRGREGGEGGKGGEMVKARKEKEEGQRPGLDEEAALVTTALVTTGRVLCAPSHGIPIPRGPGRVRAGVQLEGGSRDI